MAKSRRQVDELVVHGWIREINEKVPSAIVNECFKWYYISSHFIEGPSKVNINEDGDIVTATEMNWCEWNSVYGSVIMSSISQIDIEYKYRIKVEGCCHGISIGIDDAECEHQDGDFAGNSTTHNYAFIAMDQYTVMK